MAEAIARGVTRTHTARTSILAAASPLAAVVLTVTTIALVLRLMALDRESLWLDEAYSLLFSVLPLPKLVTVGGAHEHPPLYYLVVHEMMQVWPSYLVGRVLSAVAGGMSVGVMFVLGRRLHSVTAGLVAAALLTLSPFHLWYSRDARPYELAGLFVLLSYLFLVNACEGGRKRTWVLFVLATLSALYTEYTTILVLAPQALFLGRSPRGLVTSWTAIGLGFAPWLGVLLHNTVRVAADYWIPVPSMRDVTFTVLQFLGVETPCASPPCTGAQISLVAGHNTAIAGVAGVLVVAGAAYAITSRDFTVSLLSGWLLTPFAIILPLSFARSLYLDRVFLDASLAFYLLVGVLVASLARLRSGRVAAVALAALLLIGNGVTARLVYSEPSNPDWRPLSRDLGTAYRPGQAVVFYPGVLRKLVHAYLPTGWRATRERSLWSRSYLDVPGWKTYDGDADTSSVAARARVEAAVRNRQLIEVSSGANQVWLVTLDYPGLNPTRQWFIQHGFQPLVSEIYAGDTRLELWGRDDPSSLGHDVLRSHTSDNWMRHGSARVRGGIVSQQGAGGMTTAFPVSAGTSYSVRAEYRAVPAAAPSISLETFDRRGRSTGVFPRTMWYELPVNGVWLSQPFGFVAPPSSVLARLTVSNRWGFVEWRRLGVFGGSRTATHARTSAGGGTAAHLLHSGATGIQEEQ